MSTSSNPHQEPREHPSTYMVQDRSSEEEMTRLRVQDQMVTTSMGGVLAEQPDSTTFRKILDVGCGTGGWLIETAKTYPSTSLLVGVDASSRMLAYARTQAEAQGVSDRVEFTTMDALRMLEFPNNFFDLVNLRFGQSWLRTWDWPKLVQEFGRVAQPGGVIRVTECNPWESNSPAERHLSGLWLKAIYQAGHYFTLESSGVTSELARLLRRHGVRDVQTCSYRLEFCAGTPEGKRFCKDVQLAYRTTVPFMRKWTQVPDDYEIIYQQMLNEMQRPDFTGTWDLLTAWGKTLE